MAGIDGYVKRFKSLSLILLGATLVTYEVADSKSRIDTDFETVQLLHFTAKLIDADTSSKQGRINKVDSAPVADWLIHAERSLPSEGKLVDLIRLWNAPSSRIDGEFTLSNGELVMFTRWPITNNDSHTNKNLLTQLKGNPKCVKESAGNNCHLLSLYQDSNSLSGDALLLYDTDKSQSNRDQAKIWFYYDEKDKQFAKTTIINSKIAHLSTPWIGSTDTGENAYASLRDKRQQSTVRIPVINIDIKSASASIFLSLLAFFLAALMTHSLFAISNSPSTSIEEPWIIQSVHTENNQLMRGLQRALSFGGTAVNLALLWSPLIIIYFAIKITQSNLLIIVQSIIFIVSLLLITASTVKLIAIISRSRVELNNV